MNASFFCRRNILKGILYQTTEKIKLFLKVKCCNNLSEQVRLNLPERYRMKLMKPHMLCNNWGVQPAYQLFQMLIIYWYCLGKKNKLLKAEK